MDYREGSSGHPQVWKDASSSLVNRSSIPGASPSPYTNDNYMNSPDYSIYGNSISQISGEVQGGLVVQDVQLSDAGVYRCRVDFILSPTRNAKIKFTVIGKSNFEFL